MKAASFPRSRLRCSHSKKCVGLVVGREMTFTKDEIMQQDHFQEQYFKSEVRM